MSDKADKFEETPMLMQEFKSTFEKTGESLRASGLSDNVVAIISVVILLLEKLASFQAVAQASQKRDGE
jgi:hypothetical protein